MQHDGRPQRTVRCATRLRIAILVRDRNISVLQKRACQYATLVLNWTKSREMPGRWLYATSGSKAEGDLTSRPEVRSACVRHAIHSTRARCAQPVYDRMAVP